MENGMRVKYHCGFSMDSSSLKLHFVIPFIFISLFFILF
jgi:hypothetical protein